jgi:hypothetical protein
MTEVANGVVLATVAIVAQLALNSKKHDKSHDSNTETSCGHSLLAGMLATILTCVRNSLMY